MPDTRINRPGAPTNPPHTAREGTGISDYHPAPAPSGAVPPLTDSDPHPSDESLPRARPGGIPMTATRARAAEQRSGLATDKAQATVREEAHRPPRAISTSAPTPPSTPAIPSPSPTTPTAAPDTAPADL